ncbi:hypothetical protein PHYSODRAFT_256840 [Phytophthora sojae]|uniref:BZIP domain-containing protein n=1 Tax=Phytophthora sojae (strain P6497) TaxID=1094619 RepID=G5A5H8_PHYSP|nr:hypothetical protein PHYSODRAFT_256840 [Phytophthora sojae]EGZ08583.1 hypothetical protein PHYSODRAFT_256840 [Phytophthora sojae]|eukprot:XP_009535216.1 hypothetical protein PHYSODRAFT_256840 [Phytophthora sojae]
MSLLFEPSSLSSCFFEPVVGDEQVSVPEILAMLDGVLEGDLSLESLQHEDLSVLDPKTRSLKRLRPCPNIDEVPKGPKPKRGRRPTAARPRLRNKGKIEILRREIETLEAELEALKNAEQDIEEPQADSLWKIIATKQREEREKAESENKALKSLLSAQCTLTTSLSGVLSEWTSLPDQELSLTI